MLHSATRGEGMNEQFDLSSGPKGLMTMIRAVFAGMQVVQSAQRSPQRQFVVTQKHDGTSVTSVDMASQTAVLRVLEGLDILVWAEEAPPMSVSGLSEVLILDPLDGTSAFGSGLSTSTVALALFHPRRSEVSVSLVGVPTSGELIMAVKGKGAWRTYLRPIDTNFGLTFDPLRRIRVSETPLAKGRVFYDFLNQSFKKTGYPSFPNGFDLKLQTSLGRLSAGLFNTGSNCLHHSLVAKGWGASAAAVTSQVGGPWDIAGGLIVEEAGGAVRAFSTKTGLFVEVPSEAIDEANFYVSGNSLATVDVICNFVGFS